MKLTDIDLRTMLEFSPEHGKLLLGEDRMLLFRQDSFSVLRRLMYEQLGEELAKAIFSQFGYRCGYGDFQSMNKNHEWDTDQDRFGAGPVMHTWEGIVHVEPTFLEFDRETEHFHMTALWRNSYEAEIHIEQFGVARKPVCHSLTGYASGWCSAFMGLPLIAIETRCTGQGDERCEVEIRPPDRWGSEAESWKQSLRATSYSLARELEDKIATIEQQATAIAQLSTPVMEVWEGVLVMPILGVVNAERSMEMMETLLHSIVKYKSKCVIIDITGVDTVDATIADRLLEVVRAATLLGARSVLTGLSPGLAQTLIHSGADLREVRTLGSLKEGLDDCIRYLNGGGLTTA